MLAKPKTYAQAVATELPTSQQGTPTNQQKPNTDKDKAKQEREKLTITVTTATAPTTTKNQLKTMHAKDLIQKCQSAIKEQFKEGHIPKIHGVNKLSNGAYRFHCESKEDPQLLSKMDWNSIFDGVKVHKRKYGLVIHGILKKDLDPRQGTEDEYEETKQEIEDENDSRNLHIEQITRLRRTEKYLDKAAAHHSLIFFTNSMEEADECIRRGIFIKGKYYKPEKYTPQFNITQCFKCYKFGHLAKHCKNEQKCGNCGEKEHETANCNNITKCIGCGDSHPAWHIECCKRDEEGNRLKAKKQTATDYYSE
jgi:cyclophilin family peptidyl-prolyl cis-trans isomerase